MRGIASTLALALALLVSAPRAQAHGAVAASPPADPAASPSSEEAILEGRLMAPCCWVQTLDVHESELATSLRHEIRTRLGAGETAVEIEQDFVARYGERVRALPAGQDPRKGLGSLAVAVAAVAAVGLGLAIRRWRRAGDAALEPKKDEASRDAYDDRVDEELRQMDV